MSSNEVIPRSNSQTDAYDAYTSKLRASIKVLNGEAMEHSPFQVGNDGILLVGGIEYCESLSDFITIKDVRPGVWKSWFTHIGPNDRHSQYEGVHKAVHLQFLSDEGQVDYTKPLRSLTPSEEGQRLAEGLEEQEWEHLCTLWNAATCGILAQEALSETGVLFSDSLEIDYVLAAIAVGDDADSVYSVGPTALPGGVVCSAGLQDGSPDVLGKRDGQGRLVRVMCDFWD